MSLSIQSDYLTGATTLGLQNASATTKSVVSETQKQEDEESNATAVSADGDTLEISASGTAFQQKTFTATSAQSGLDTVLAGDEGYTSSTASIVSSAASSAGITEYTSTQAENSADASTVSSSSSSDSSSNLSSYTTAQLKQMLENGEITQAEYNEEIASRQSGSTDTEDEETQAVAGAASVEEEN